MGYKCHRIQHVFPTSLKKENIELDTVGAKCNIKINVITSLICLKPNNGDGQMIWETVLRLKFKQKQVLDKLKRMNC